MTGLPILDRIEAQRLADFERERRKAASGTAGCVAAREAMKRVVHEALREAAR